jgi:hypothetical protein
MMSKITKSLRVLLALTGAAVAISVSAATFSSQHVSTHVAAASTTAPTDVTTLGDTGWG